MKKLRVLDCTLRDGGCVNDFNFGIANMKSIKQSLENSGVDIIECGYIDENKGSSEGRSQFDSEISIQNQILDQKKPNTLYVAMIDYGKFDCSHLQKSSDASIDGIRIAFHKKDRWAAIPMCKTVLEKGYRLFVQPMAILRYTDSEILELLSMINQELPETEAFYIVDSFGEMRLDDFRRILCLVDHNLNQNIAIGFHSHNNLQLSYANAIQFIEYRSARHRVIDASIMGMGKGAGNLNTELLLEHLNNSVGSIYDIHPLMDLIDKVINQIYSEYKWGYAVEYYLSAMNSCTPSYAKYFYEKHLMSIGQISALLELLDEDKKVSFDKDYADAVYFAYNDKKISDDLKFELLCRQIGSKKVLLLAPGHSIVEYHEKIHSILNDPLYFSIMLNMVDGFETDYLFLNKPWLLSRAKKLGHPIIMLSNMGAGTEHDIVLDYAKWTNNSALKIESSFQIIMNILQHIGVQEIYLAGFDGFELDIEKNYYSDELKRRLSKAQIAEMNDKTRQTIQHYSSTVDFHFVTPSRYEEMV